MNNPMNLVYDNAPITHDPHDTCWLTKATINQNVYTQYHITPGEATPILLSLHKEASGLLNIPCTDSREQADLVLALVNNAELGQEGFSIDTCANTKVTTISAQNHRGLLYGFFRLINMLQSCTCTSKAGLGTDTCAVKSLTSVPANAIRMINHWDNMDGTVERGYAGRSIFFDNNQFMQNQNQIVDYVRLLASTGINAMTINNVNVHHIETYLIRQPLLDDVARLASIMRGYGISLYLSVNFASPITMGELSTSDPLDPQVMAWWKQATETVYSVIPDFGGFVIKADSEGRPGPFAYDRTHAEGANMIAKALKPHGGTLFWRCFVYNHLQDWRDRSTDRARAAYDHFMPLDGQFDDNVVLQIKNGPMDFQVREATSPLFGGLRKTNQVLEFQVAHEYTGQAKHIFYLPTMWEEILAFDTHADLADSTIAGVLQNYPSANNPMNGITAVVNVGRDLNLTGHKLSQANLYGFGRLCWEPTAKAADLASEWLNATFTSEKAKPIIKDMLLSSMNTYENYTAPLGVGFMVKRNHHYGVGINDYEFDKWGTYHFSDRNGLGVDRTVATGTGYTRQYQDKNFALYEDIKTCPDELLLFFHHVPYGHVLHSGKTVIQHIYDTHFAGVEAVEAYIAQWESIKPELDHASYTNVANRLQEQLRSAEEWRDQINTYYYRMSGVEDAQGRAIYK